MKYELIINTVDGDDIQPAFATRCGSIDELCEALGVLSKAFSIVTPEEAGAKVEQEMRRQGIEPTRLLP